MFSSSPLSFSGPHDAADCVDFLCESICRSSAPANYDNDPIRRRTGFALANATFVTVHNDRPFARLFNLQ
ncbi:hypothetical protein T265_12371 [Opisthorchis viverrini]|uniref:Uncharacterized protein n=1 Tax=Opisthorchis viverrini TaxID=6198 RepID=A0A074YTR1_OPIVI|nr:hypothetical protein T265_12371 [Opisthorchis viverrini]KER18113.1 hypothetical protein T265_12371 [Opisthorchis viverrini]